MYKGNERQRAVEVSVDGVFVTSWTSSGQTLDFESVDLSGSYGRDVTITAILGDSEWISITETEIMVLSDGITPPPAPTPSPAPVQPTLVP
ncbi:unnamed protein product, partial [Pylaiella littoralis]